MKMQAIRLLLIFIALAAFALDAKGQTWTALNHAPPVPIGYMALMTDGTVLAHEEEFSSGDANWYKLTPDTSGSYVNGTWSEMASLPSGYGPTYFCGGVLADGHLLIEGGEYNESEEIVETNRGAIYNPVANSWTTVTPPSGWGNIGDCTGAILASNTFLIGQSGSASTANALFNENALTWITTGTNKADANEEEDWVLLPSGQVLNAEVYFGNYNATGTASEVYNSLSGQWSSAGSTVAQVWDSAAACGGAGAASYEEGPAVLQPSGVVLYTGANQCGPGNTALYNTASGTWTAGPTFPSDLNIADGPAALEVNGRVVMMASPGLYLGPATFLEWNGSILTEITGPSTAANDASFVGQMLELPSGQILFSDFSQHVQVLTPAGTYEPAWQPTIASAPTSLTPGATYAISGTLFNGLSQGAMYGDDAQMASNYPLVRLVNTATGHVYYCRTHGHTSMGVATGSEIVYTNFDVPSTVPTGAAKLYVVANGIPSNPVTVEVGNSPTFTMTATNNNPSQTGLSLGHSMSYTVNVSPVSGFTGTVLLSIEGLPAGVTAQFSPISINTSGSATLTLTAAYAESTYTGGNTGQLGAQSAVTVTGTSGSTAQSVAFALTTRPLQYKGYCNVQ